MPVPPEENSRAGRRVAIICAIVAVMIVVILAGNIIYQAKETHQQSAMSGDARH